MWLSTGSKCTYIIQSVPHCILVCFPLQYFSKTNPKYSLLRLQSLPRKPRLHINLRNPLSRYNILFRYLKNSGLLLYQATDVCMNYVSTVGMIQYCGPYHFLIVWQCKTEGAGKMQISFTSFDSLWILIELTVLMKWEISMDTYILNQRQN